MRASQARRSQVTQHAYDAAQLVVILYTNYRGETARRKIIPSSIWFGSTEYHPKAQWLLEAYDVEKGADRTFAIADVAEWTEL